MGGKLTLVSLSIMPSAPASPRNGGTARLPFHAEVTSSDVGALPARCSVKNPSRVLIGGYDALGGREGSSAFQIIDFRAAFEAAVGADHDPQAAVRVGGKSGDAVRGGAQRL